MVNTNYAHDNSVTCVCWKGNILATGSMDCTVKVKYLRSYCAIHNVIYKISIDIISLMLYS